MALKRNKQTSVETGLKREKTDSTALLDFFKENNQDAIGRGLGTQDSGDEMMMGAALQDDKYADADDVKPSTDRPTVSLINPKSEDELLNATLVDYESLLRKNKQKDHSVIETESQPTISVLQDNTLHGISIGDGAQESARKFADKSNVLPLSRENKHELDVLAEIRELIKSASSNLNNPAIEYMNEYNKLEQRHRTGLGENRVNDVTMKKVAYEDEYPKQLKEASWWPPTKQSSTTTKESGATALPTNGKVNGEHPSSGLYEEIESDPTKSSLQRHDKFKFNLTPSSRHRLKTTHYKGTKGSSRKGKAIIKDVGDGDGSLLQTLMRKMQEVREKVDDEGRSYSGGVSLGAVYQGDMPVKGITPWFCYLNNLFQRLLQWLQMIEIVRITSNRTYFIQC